MRDQSPSTGRKGGREDQILLSFTVRRRGVRYLEEVCATAQFSAAHVDGSVATVGVTD